jgi:serine/threonine protein kinase/Tol biopolymer transport system component
MPLPPNTLLGRYEIRSQIGAGGMGEVYLAQDTKLERTVALKVLHADVAQDQQRMRRFMQEARAASALNHPYILTIHEIGEADSVRFIATEFIQGETLRQHMRRAKMPLDEILNIAIQIADALSAAHAAKIIHRDIKPENVMVRSDGYVKVLDFGLAKLIEREASSDAEAPTLAMVNTEPGMVMGTAAYMSPEQARGLETDERTDTWSLGVMLYEMVARQPPFHGNTPSDIIASILKTNPPPLQAVGAEVPAELERIVMKALEKDRDERYQTAKDFLADLRRLKKRVDFEAELDRSHPSDIVRQQGVSQSFTPQSTAEAITNAATPTDKTSQPHPTSSAEYIVSGIKRHKTVALGLLLIIVAGLGYGLYRFFGTKKPVARFERIKMEKLTTLGNVNNVVISPDGKFISYTLAEGDKQSLWTKYLPTGSVVQIVAPAKFKFLGDSTFSPDGNFIYYNALNDENTSFTLFQTPVLGGATPKKIMQGMSSSVTFSPDGKQFAFLHWVQESVTYELCIAGVDGSNVKTIAAKSQRNGEWFSEAGPAWSPDGKILAIGAGSSEGGDKMTVVAVAVDTGQIKRLMNQDWDEINRIAWFSDGSGFVVNAQALGVPGDQIWQVAYPGGEVRRITNGLNLNEYGGLSLGLTADNKTIAAMYEEGVSDVWLAPSNAPDKAHAEQITTHGQQYNGCYGIAWTADGRLVYTSYAAGNSDIWIMKTDGTEQKQLNDDTHFDAHPDVSPDGRYLVFNSMRTGNENLWRMNLDGSNLKQLTSGKADEGYSIMPDGQWIIYRAQEGDHAALLKVSIDGGAPVHLAITKSIGGVALSPDGKLVAYAETTEENGAYAHKLVMLPIEGGDPVKSFVLPIAGFGNSQQLGWTPDGRSIIYTGAQTEGGKVYLWRQPLAGSPSTIYADFTPESVIAFAFSRDGKQLALSLGHTTQDAVLISEDK